MEFPGGSVINNPSVNTRDACSIPSLGICPGKGNDNPFLSILAWEIPWTEGLTGYIQSMRLQSQTQLND